MGDLISEIRRMIRQIEDPVELQHQLEKLIEQQFPAPPALFRNGETLPLWKFLETFKRAVCDGIEPRLSQWPVRVVVEPGGELMLALGTSAAGKVHE